MREYGAWVVLGLVAACGSKDRIELPPVGVPEACLQQIEHPPAPATDPRQRAEGRRLITEAAELRAILPVGAVGRLCRAFAIHPDPAVLFELAAAADAIPRPDQARHLRERAVKLIGPDAKLELFEVATGQRRESPTQPGPSDPLAVRSPDGLRLAAAVGSAVFVIPLAKGVPYVVGRHAGGVTALAFAADGRLISAGRDGQLVVRDLSAGGKQVGGLPVPADAILAISPDGARIAITAGMKMEVRAIDGGKVIQTASLLKEPDPAAGGGGAPAGSAGAPEGPASQSGASPARSGMEPGQAGTAAGAPESAAGSSAGSSAGTTGGEGSSAGAVGSPAGGAGEPDGAPAPSEVIGGPRAEVYGLRFSDNGKYVAALIEIPYALGGVSALLDLSSGTIENFGGAVLGFSPDSRTAAIYVKEVHTGPTQQTEHQTIVLRSLVNDSRRVQNVLDIEALAFRPDGRLVALGKSGTTELWDLKTGRIAGSLAVPGLRLAFLGGGKLLAMMNGSQIVFADAAPNGARRAELRLREDGGWFAAAGGKVEAGGGLEQLVRWRAGDAWYPLAAPLPPPTGSLLADALGAMGP